MPPSGFCAPPLPIYVSPCPLSIHPLCPRPTASFSRKGCSYVPSLARGPPPFHPPPRFAPPAPRWCTPTASFVREGHSHATPFSRGLSPHVPRWHPALRLPRPFSPVRPSPPFGV